MHWQQEKEGKIHALITEKTKNDEKRTIWKEDCSTI